MRNRRLQMRYDSEPEEMVFQKSQEIKDSNMEFYI